LPGDRLGRRKARKRFIERPPRNNDAKPEQVASAGRVAAGAFCHCLTKKCATLAVRWPNKPSTIVACQFLILAQGSPHVNWYRNKTAV
jgi:hypothetical protein